MLNEKWPTFLLWSFLVVAITHSLLASLTRIYYSRSSPGELTHSQLRIKQQSATAEHRINVFAQAFLFSFTNLKIYLITLLLWFIVNLLLYITR